MSDDTDDLTRSRQFLTDTEHLRTLSILHYVFGGLQFFGALFGLIYVVLGGFAAAGSLPIDSPNDRAALQFFGTIFLVIGLLVILLNLAIGTALVYAGRCLSQHRAYTYCFIIALLECLGFPLGTLLGVFTIIVLQRETVKERFAANSARYELG